MKKLSIKKGQKKNKKDGVTGDPLTRSMHVVVVAAAWTDTRAFMARKNWNGTTGYCSIIHGRSERSRAFLCSGKKNEHSTCRLHSRAALVRNEPA